MKLFDRLATQVLVLDGAMGTEIQKRIGKSADVPEVLNIDERSQVIADIHRAYIQAGADVIETNTFGANRVRLADSGLSNRVEEINRAAVQLAQKARGDCSDILIAGSLGPTGKLLHPLGDLQGEEAYAVYAEQARILEEAGADFLLIETQIDIHTAKTAQRAAKAATSLPVVVCLAFPQENERTVTGSDPETAAVVFATPDTDMYGINCGGHPRKLVRILERTLSHTRKPLAVYANAGDPEKHGDTTVFPLGPEEYLPFALKYHQLGASLIGGCCGTTPDHIRLIAQELKGKKPVSRPETVPGFRAAGRAAILQVGKNAPFRKIGENINPFARKELKEEIKQGRLDLARNYARRQEKAGAHALDINLGKRGEEEPGFYAAGVAELQQLSNLPFFLDNRNPEALEAALKNYAGKAVINSVTAENKSREVLLPLAKRYGAGVILLAMDDEGIPEDARSRFELLKGLYQQALSLGLNPEDLLVDPVVMALASAPDKAIVTLDTIEQLSSQGIPTTLGLSNISFGLPRRRLLNSAFLGMARQRGLDSAILDPLDEQLTALIHAGDALTNKDPGFKRYVRIFGDVPEEGEDEEDPLAPPDPKDALFKAVLEGEKTQVKPQIDILLAQGHKGFSILSDILSPAIAKAGEYYEQKIYFLPQLILAAEAMETASKALEGTYQITEKASRKEKIVLATVKGDLHDIGKNIVHLVLRNSWFEVIDMGKNMDAQTILDTALKEKAKVVGLSSLMTTTMDEMERFIQLRNGRAPGLRVILGGAAVSAQFARRIGADAYGRDAMDAVRQIKKLLGQGT